MCCAERELSELIAAVAAAPRAALVLIDGPSGAGKSTLADRLVEGWPTDAVPQLVRLDSVYPGWDGLDAGARQLRTGLLEPRAAGRPAGWRRWDWEVGRAAEWHPVHADRPLIVEGCGALGWPAPQLADVTVWVDERDDVRKRRALERDAGGFDAHWQQWQEQWLAYTEREDPRAHAQIVLGAREPGGAPAS